MPTQLPDIFGQTPGWGPLPSPQPDLYCEVKSEKARDPEYDTSGKCWDYRKVTFTLHGPKPAVATAIQNVLAVFNAGLLPTSMAAQTGKPTLVYPSGATFLRWKPLDRGTIAPDPQPKKGDQIFMGTVTAEVWSERTN